MAGQRPHVLVVVESRHGATREIAGVLAQRLVAAGLSVTVSPPDECRTIDADIVVVGSAVYFGKWLRPALRFIDDHSAELASRPVWLFSSGPLDDDPETHDGIEDEYVAELTARAHASRHHVFTGRLDRTALGPVEKLIASSVDAPEGDFRDWPDVRGWADEIAVAAAASDERR